MTIEETDVVHPASLSFRVVLAAEHDIKRLTVAVDWNSMQHVQSLFEFFLGTAKTVKTQQQQVRRSRSSTEEKELV